MAALHTERISRPHTAAFLHLLLTVLLLVPSVSAACDFGTEGKPDTDKPPTFICSHTVTISSEDDCNAKVSEEIVLPHATEGTLRRDIEAIKGVQKLESIKVKEEDEDDDDDERKAESKQVDDTAQVTFPLAKSSDEVTVTLTYVLDRAWTGFKKDKDDKEEEDDKDDTDDSDDTKNTLSWLVGPGFFIGEGDDDDDKEELVVRSFNLTVEVGDKDKVKLEESDEQASNSLLYSTTNITEVDKLKFLQSGETETCKASKGGSSVSRVAVAVFVILIIAGIAVIIWYCMCYRKRKVASQAQYDIPAAPTDQSTSFV